VVKYFSRLAVGDPTAVKNFSRLAAVGTTARISPALAAVPTAAKRLII